MVNDADREAAQVFLENWEPGPEMTAVKLARAFETHRIAALEEAKARHLDEVTLTQANARDYWYRQGKDDGVQMERQNIVGYLRQFGACVCDGDAFAESIEAGRHLP